MGGAVGKDLPVRVAVESADGLGREAGRGHQPPRRGHRRSRQCHPSGTLRPDTRRVRQSPPWTEGDGELFFGKKLRLADQLGLPGRSSNVATPQAVRLKCLPGYWVFPEGWSVGPPKQNRWRSGKVAGASCARPSPRGILPRLLLFIRASHSTPTATQALSSLFPSGRFMPGLMPGNQGRGLALVARTPPILR